MVWWRRSTTVTPTQDLRTHTLSATTQPGNKSGPDKATEGTTALGSNIGDSVDSGGSAAGAVPSAGPGPGREQGPGGPSSNGDTSGSQSAKFQHTI